MKVLGTFAIIIIYLVLAIIFSFKNMKLAYKLTSRLYWFIIGFWNIAAAMIESIESNAHLYAGVISGCFLIVIGILLFVGDTIENHYEKKLRQALDKANIEYMED